MSRTLGALAPHVARSSKTLAALLRLDLSDGTAIGLTSHDQDLSVSHVGGALTYQARTGIFPSDIVLTAGLDADNCEVSGPIGATVTLAALFGGRFNRATARLFLVDWTSPATGYVPLLKGYVSDARMEGRRFILELRSDADRFNQNIGELVNPYCSGKHAACCVQIADETETTVAAVVDEYRITVAAAIDPDDFAYGKLWFTDGDLAGTLPMDIVGGTGSTLELFAPLAATPGIGDALTIKEGCNRTREMCRDRFANAINFRGCPETPGTDQMMRYPVPGE